MKLYAEDQGRNFHNITLFIEVSNRNFNLKI